MKRKCVQCKYSNKDYKHANLNKTENHIKKCFNCPTGLKIIFDCDSKCKKYPNESTSSMPSTSYVEVEENRWGCFIDGLKFIYDVGHHLKLESTQLKMDVVHYREKEGLWNRKISWLGLENIPSLS